MMMFITIIARNLWAVFFFHFCANQASNVGVGDHPVPGVD